MPVTLMSRTSVARLLIAVMSQESLAMLISTHPFTSYRLRSYHYIRARGLGGDGPEDIIGCVPKFPSYEVKSRIYKIRQKAQITFRPKKLTTEYAGMITVTDTSGKVEIHALAPFSHINWGRISVPSFRRLGIG